MWKKLKAAQISAVGLVGLQASTVEQISNAKELAAIRELEAKAVITRAENFESIADALRQEAADKREEAAKATRWATKLEKTLA